MAKILKAKFPENCIGCEMCVMEVQQQLKKVGLEGSLIRIFRNPNEKSGVAFSIDIDPRVNKLEIEKVKNVCPGGVYVIEEENE